MNLLNKFVQVNTHLKDNKNIKVISVIEVTFYRKIIMSKYYKLNKMFALRGWQKLPYAIVNLNNGITKFINEKEMELLNYANGEIDFELPIFSNEQLVIADKLVELNILTLSDKPSPILDKQKYRYHDNRYMQSVHWSMTGRCNYKCKHCYMSACTGKYGELSHEQCLEIIRQMADCGIHRISLTGGEALIRSDFFELVDALIENDITIYCLYSNGQLINEKTLNELEKRNLHPEINMSFDGTEGWHDWLRGVNNASEAIDKAFKLCKEHGFTTGAEMCLHEKNKHTLRDSINYLASVGCSSLKTNPISDVGAWHDGGYGKSIDNEDLFNIYLDYIPHYYEDGKPLTIQLGGFFMAYPNQKGFYVPSIKPENHSKDFSVCGHARNQMYISAEGRALPCMSLSGQDIQNEYPLILDKGLKYCLTDSSYMKLITTKASDIIAHNERCKTCEYASRCCGGCRAAALDSTPNDIEGIDEVTCLIFKGHYYDKIASIVKQFE